jgi:hypothetical protein
MEIWDGDHLSELALSCIADAQDVVDPVARAHAETCADCARRVGEMALESHAVGSALKVARARSREARPKHAFPTLLVAAASVVAMACGLPTLVEALPNALAWVFAAPRILPVFTTTAVALSKNLPGGAAVSLVSTLALALFGFAVARASSKNGATE